MLELQAVMLYSSFYKPQVYMSKVPANFNALKKTSTKRGCGKADCLCFSQHGKRVNYFILFTLLFLFFVKYVKISGRDCKP